MDTSVEVLFRQRVCRARACGAIFYICIPCDRGQQYCSDHCRAKALREQRRAANLRHRQSTEGRLDQRDRQQAYRQRLSAVSVMDQGSPDEHSAGNIPTAVISPPIAPENGGESLLSAKVHEPGVPCCVICGRYGRFVDPFQLYRPRKT